MEMQKLLPFFLLLCYFCVFPSNSVSFEEDMRLSLPEKSALDAFKKKVRGILPHAYMKEDIYLIRWLRAQNFNLGLAEQMLKNNLRWRKEHKIDTLLNEDWTAMRAEYPYTTDTFDKEGRPIGACNLGQWNIRRIALAGHMPTLQRYLNSILETGMHLVLKEQRKGNNVTQYNLLLDLNNFNAIQHACPICLPAYTSFVSTYEEHYPGFLHQAVHINTPPVYDIVLNLIRPLFSPATSKALKIFGTNKAEWMKYLDKEISRDQRRVEFGGTLK